MQAEGEFAVVKQKLERALRLEGQPVKRGTMAHEHVVAMMLADAAAQARDLPGIKQYASILEELSLRDGHRPYLAVAQRAWGVAYGIEGDHGEALTKLQAALAIFEEMGAGWQIGRTRVELGELAQAVSDTEAARDHFAEAQAAFEALGAAPDLERMKLRIAG